MTETLLVIKRLVCKNKKTHIQRCASKASGMVFHALLVLNGVLIQRRGSISDMNHPSSPRKMRKEEEKK